MRPWYRTPQLAMKQKNQTTLGQQIEGGHGWHDFPSVLEARVDSGELTLSDLVVLFFRISFRTWQRSMASNTNSCNTNGRDGCTSKRRSRELSGGKTIFGNTIWGKTIWDKTIWSETIWDEMIVVVGLLRHDSLSLWRCCLRQCLCGLLF